jgi:hypothetical protein
MSKKKRKFKPVVYKPDSLYFELNGRVELIEVSKTGVVKRTTIPAKLVLRTLMRAVTEGLQDALPGPNPKD